MTISMKRDEVDYSPKCVWAIYFSTVIYGPEVKSSNKARISTIPNQLQEISSLELLTNQGRVVIGGIQPMFVYQSPTLDYMNYWKTRRWKKTPMSMWLRRPRKITYDHLSMQRHM